MKPTLCLLVLPLLAIGCVERTYTIRTNPPGALVFRDGVLLGSSPVSEKFTHYGKRKFRIVKEGYEAANVVVDIPRPWYQYAFIDFIFEHLVPVHFDDRHEYLFNLEPKKHTRTDELLQRARQQRSIGKTIGEPAPGEAVPYPPPEVAPPGVPFENPPPPVP